MHEALAAFCSEKLAAGEWVQVTGRTPASQRGAALESFKSEPRCRFALLALTACSQGLNLACADTCVFTELAWSTTLMEQAEARVHRIGQRAGRVNLYYLTADGPDSPDGLLYNALSKKARAAAAVVDGGRPADDLADAQLLSPPRRREPGETRGAREAGEAGETGQAKPQAATAERPRARPRDETREEVRRGEASAADAAGRKQRRLTFPEAINLESSDEEEAASGAAAAAAAAAAASASASARVAGSGSGPSSAGGSSMCSVGLVRSRLAKLREGICSSDSEADDGPGRSSLRCARPRALPPPECLVDCAEAAEAKAEAMRPPIAPPAAASPSAPGRSWSDPVVLE